MSLIILINCVINLKLHTKTLLLTKVFVINMNCLLQQNLFRRAEALKGMLACQMDNRPQKTYKDVLNDYVKCYRLSADLDAFYNAVILGHEHGKLLFSLP